MVYLKVVMLMALMSPSAAQNLRRRPLAMELADSEPPKVVAEAPPAANAAIPTRSVLSLSVPSQGLDFIQTSLTSIVFFIAVQCDKPS